MLVRGVLYAPSNGKSHHNILPLKYMVDSLLPSGKTRKILIIVENLPLPFDRRVWQEATAMTKAGYEVSINMSKRERLRENV